MATKTLIIADVRSNDNKGQCTGHFIQIARMYYELFGDMIEVKIAGGPIYKKYFKEDLLLDLPYNVLSSGQSKIKGKLKTLCNCWTLYRKAPHKSVIVLQQGTDSTSHLFSGLFHWGRKDLFLIRYSNHGITTGLQKLIYQSVKSRIKGVICPNQQIGEAYGVPFLVIPDYIYSSRIGVKIAPYETRKYDICIVGRLNEDKGVLEAINQLAKTNKQVLIAGMPDKKEYAIAIESACNHIQNIQLKLGYLSDEEYDYYIRDSKYCLLNYQGEYSIRSSGVVLDTIFRGTPVVGRSCKALNFIAENHIGILYQNIEDFDIDLLMDNKNYEGLLQNIILYRNKHIEYKHELMKFLEL